MVYFNFWIILFLILYGQKLAALEVAEGFFFPAEASTEDDEELKKADLFFEANFYDKAINAYKQIMAQKDSNSNNPKIDSHASLQARFRLSLLYVSQKKYDDAINTLLDGRYNNREDIVSQNSLFLLGVAYKSANKLEPALQTFKEYIKLSDHSALKLYQQAAFQIALIDFELEHYVAAKEVFLEIASPKDSSQKLDQRLGILASLYLARIDLQEKKYEAADSTLKSLISKVPSNDPLTYELSFLLGEVAFQSQGYLKAIGHFNHSLQFDNQKSTSWYPESLYRLGWSHLKLAEVTSDREELDQNLKKSEDLFIKMLEDNPEEKGYLALAECYLAEAKLMKKPECYAKAEAILSDLNNFKTIEGKTHSLLLRAEAAPTYEKREELFKELTSSFNIGNASYSNGWYMRGMNDFDEGLFSKEQGDIYKGRKLFCQAIDAFGKAFELFKTSDKAKAVASLKYQAIATGYLESEQSDFYAFKLIDQLIDGKSDLWLSSLNQDELLYLHGYFASFLTKNDQAYLQIALKSLEASATYPNSKFGDVSLKIIGTLHFQNQDFEKAEKSYLELVERYPDSQLCGEALFWSARCAEIQQKDKGLIAERKRRVFENYPASSYAPDAYFTLYTYQEYLQGEKAAIRHLQGFEDKFKGASSLIETYYLIGLDFIRDRKTPEGKWIRKRSMTDAIDAFQHVETLYETLNENGKLPDVKKEYYAAIRYRSTLHRAMANLSIAEEARGAKQHIYLEYAEEVFKGLINELENPQNAYAKKLKENAFHPNIYEESVFGLAKTYIMAGADEKADHTLLKLIQYYKDSDIAYGYYPARSWEERGRIALRDTAYSQALDYFSKAEESSNYLGTDQKLDLWIQQSLCNRGLKDYDEAILILSKVVNDDAVSSLRMKAMYLRAETYELQGRSELAKKQLESMVKKGGVWALKAKEKLEKKYGY